MSSLEDVEAFLRGHFGQVAVDNIEPLGAAASKRNYFRVKIEKTSYMVCRNHDIAENRSFIYFSGVLRRGGVPVPEVFTMSANEEIYLQEDLGNFALIDVRKNRPQESLAYYKKALEQLVDFQTGAHPQVDYNQCFDFQEFEPILVLRDLFAFKNYFLDVLNVPYSQHGLLKEFEQLAQHLASANYLGLMFRDFQARNIMIHKDMPYFIDFQGAMKGPLAYDLVSLLWQSRAELSQDERNMLFEHYTHHLANKVDFDADRFESDYSFCLMERLLQVMGTYGFQGLYLKKETFTNSILAGIRNLEEMANLDFMNNFPEIRGLIAKLIIHFQQFKDKC